MRNENLGGEDRVRTAELIAVCSLATDLGMGFPFEHGLHATLITQRLARLVDVDVETARQSYYVSLLMYVGCTTDSELSTRLFEGNATDAITPRQFGSYLENLAGVAAALTSEGPPALRWPRIAKKLPEAARYRTPHFGAMCEVAEMLARRLGLPPEMYHLFSYLTERWDGKGVLRRAEGEDIPLALRIAHVARDAAYQHLVFGTDDAAEIIRSRGGHAFDPAIAEAFADAAAEVLAAADTRSVWEDVLAAEPKPWLMLEGDEIDRSLAAMGDFSDMVSSELSGHARGVAELVAAAAEFCSFDKAEKTLAVRAAYVHDLGRVAIAPGIWQKSENLNPDEWEQVRMHPYYTERILGRSPLLADLSAVASSHHERTDGSGYHRGAKSPFLSRPSRLLATADAFYAMTEPRPHRPAATMEQAVATLGKEANAGRMDPEMVRAVAKAAGQDPPTIERPAGLTEREVEVLGLLARGLQTKQIAHAIDVSIKTADQHIQNAYRKMGVSSRAAATLFAMEHGLVSAGDPPHELR